jgi:hypothetical protein
MLPDGGSFFHPERIYYLSCLWADFCAIDQSGVVAQILGGTDRPRLPVALFCTADHILTVVLSDQPMTGIYDVKALPAVILLLHSFGVNHGISWNVPSWSISAELSM